jgi:hypothetical protein
MCLKGPCDKGSFGAVESGGIFKRWGLVRGFLVLGGACP